MRFDRNAIIPQDLHEILTGDPQFFCQFVYPHVVIPFWR